MNYDPCAFYTDYYHSHPSLMRYTPQHEPAWRAMMYDKLLELLAMPPKEIEPAVVIEYREQHPLYEHIRYNFEAEPGLWIPCHLLIPEGQQYPCPVMICVQGHSSGMHISLGQALYDGDAELIEQGEDYAIEAVRQGYAALVVEQRCFGEREDRTSGMHAGRCYQPSMQALLLGRTMIGDRVFDVCRAIDSLSFFEAIDTDKIGMIGNSGGGTATFFTACADPRVKIAVPSGYFTPLEASIFSLVHCQCNYIPGLLQYFDLPDLTALIAPRPLILVLGREDPIFPFPPSEKAYSTVQAIYREANAADRCVMIAGDGAHRFFAQPTWTKIEEYAKMLGWGK